MTLAGRIMQKLTASAVSAGVWMVIAAAPAWCHPAAVSSMVRFPVAETGHKTMASEMAEMASVAEMTAAPAADSAAFAALGKKLDEYVEAILPLPVAEQEEESDFLISSCRDSLTRQYVALRLFRSYYSSKIMGVEAVAVHVFDRWFASGEVKMQDDVELMNARIFAGFNRRSLVGMKAEQLSLRNMDGCHVSLFGADASGVAETGRGRLRILYFYDTGCANCLATTVLLRSLLQEEDYPVDFYAVYSGADSLAWRKYAGERLAINADRVRVYHLWDPDMESDFQRKYGVLQTPMLFLVGCDGKIIGRRLDAPALKILLDDAVANLEYEYGGDESEAMLDALFGATGTTAADAETVIDTIAERSGADSILYAHVMGDLLYYLSVRPEGYRKDAAKYLIDRYILPESQLWAALGDSLEVTGYAKAMDELLSRALPGAVIPKIFVRGRMLDRRIVRRLTRHLPDAAPDEAYGETSVEVEKIPVRRWNLRRLPGQETCVIFYSKDCTRCQETLAAAFDAAIAGRRLLLIDMDDNVPAPEADDGGNLLLDTFDLTSLPYIIRLSGKGVVMERYLEIGSKSLPENRVSRS